MPSKQVKSRHNRNEGNKKKKSIWGNHNILCNIKLQKNPTSINKPKGHNTANNILNLLFIYSKSFHHF